MGVRLVKYGVINGTGTYNHDEMDNRDLPDQHPISAITGLEKVLEQINIDIQNVTGIESTIETRSLKLNYDETAKTLTGNVKIFDSEENAIQEKATGLFVDKSPEIETEDTHSVHLYTEGLGETLLTMYQNRRVFSHSGSWNNIANQSEANAWYFDNNLSSFVQPQNTGSFTGFVSTVKYKTYTHRATLRSSDGDNDANGLVIGYVTDSNGHPHTLSCIVNKGAEGHAGSFHYAIVYNRSLPGEQLIKTGKMSNGHSNGGWNNNFITMEVSKAGSTIECSISDWNSYTINLNTVITIDLDDYTWGNLFKGRVQYGYCNQSQANSYFTNIYFNGKGPLKANVILSTDDGNILEIRENGLYATCSGGSGGGSGDIDLDYIIEESDVEDTPVGNIISFMGNVVPAHYLICDGSIYNISDYPKLAEHMLNNFGAYNFFGGDGTATFAVPDLRGEFLRGSGIGNTGNIKGFGADVGIHQDPTVNDYYGVASPKNPDSFIQKTTQAEYLVSVEADDNEQEKLYTSRPSNTSVLYCIKYEPTYCIKIINDNLGEEQIALLQEQNNLLKQEVEQLNKLIETMNETVVTYTLET